MNKHVTIMDIEFYNTTKNEFLRDDLSPRLLEQVTTFVVTANPEIVMHTREDSEYKRIIQSADYVIPDGIGIIKAANMIKQPLQERIPGYDLMVDLLNYANEQHLSCYFLGAKETTNDKMIKQVQETLPGITIAGHHHGFFDLGNKDVVADIKEAQPDLIFVALGLPRQELWIDRYKDEFAKGLFIGVGGSFDSYTGEVKRAPQKWIDLNLEWLYRFIKQPVRFKRILKIIEFMIRVALRRG